MKNLSDALNLSYPGRGIIVGQNEGGNFVLAYFLTGRSTNSRNRIFVREKDGLRTKAYDDKLLTDPSLIIYRPYTTFRNTEIITNGDQTETIYQTLSQGGTFEDALKKRTYEPDAPNFTPRISALIKRDEAECFLLSVLKKEKVGEGCERLFYRYGKQPGKGYFIRTYLDDGNPLPPFEGDPVEVNLCGNAESLAEEIWRALPQENKVALFVREIDQKGNATEKIINKLEDRR